jgi:hypothetical protein
MVIVHSYDNGGWIGLLADGYLPHREKLENLHRRHYTLVTATDKRPVNPKRMTRDVLLYDVMEFIRIPFCKSKYPLIWDKIKKERKCACDTYIMGIESEKIFKSPFTPISDEFAFDERRDDYKIVMFMNGQCPDSEGYIRMALDEAGFDLKEPHQYKDFAAFKNSCIELLERSLDYFNAPCMKCAENLDKIGLVTK